MKARKICIIKNVTMKRSAAESIMKNLGAEEKVGAPEVVEKQNDLQRIKEMRAQRGQGSSPSPVSTINGGGVETISKSLCTVLSDPRLSSMLSTEMLAEFVEVHVSILKKCIK